MMRHARTTSLFVAFHLLASATTAYAECAWVLWGQRVAGDSSGNPKEPYEPRSGRYDVLHAYPDQGACEAALATAIAAKPKGKDLLVCLPDTVDPRGPKAR